MSLGFLGDVVGGLIGGKSIGNSVGGAIGGPIGQSIGNFADQALGGVGGGLGGLAGLGAALGAGGARSTPQQGTSSVSSGRSDITSAGASNPAGAALVQQPQAAAPAAQAIAQLLASRDLAMPFRDNRLPGGSFLPEAGSSGFGAQSVPQRPDRNNFQAPNLFGAVPNFSAPQTQPTRGNSQATYGAFDPRLLVLMSLFGGRR